MSFTEKLRTSILSYSFSGKLTRLNLNDISVEERLHQTLLEKDQLILEKKIKKEKKVDTILEEDIPYKIPDHWKWLRLGTVLQTMLVPQRDKPKKFDGTIPWCRIEDFEGSLLNGSKSNQLVSQDTIEKMNLKVFPVGTVISANSASIGAKAINTVPCCTNQTFIGLVCSSSIYNWYLYWYLELIKPQLMKMATGTTIGYISQVKYANIMIPIPPIEEQQRIVNRVDELMAKVDVLEKIEQELDDLYSS